MHSLHWTFCIVTPALCWRINSCKTVPPARAKDVVNMEGLSSVQSLDRLGRRGNMRDDSAEILFRKLEVTIQIFVQGPSMSHFTGPLRNKGNCHGSHKKIVWCIWLKKKGRSFLAGWSDPLDCNPAAIVRLLVVAEWGSFSVLPKRTAHIRQCLSRLHMSHNTL